MAKGNALQAVLDRAKAGGDPAPSPAAPAEAPAATISRSMPACTAPWLPPPAKTKAQRPFPGMRPSPAEKPDRLYTWRRALGASHIDVRRVAPAPVCLLSQ